VVHRVSVYDVHMCIDLHRLLFINS